MKFKASIKIMPLEALLDPQGKAVGQSMGNLDINGVSNVRVGKHITLLVDSEDESSAKKIVEEACLLYTSPSPRDRQKSRMPSSA